MELLIQKCMVIAAAIPYYIIPYRSRRLVVTASGVALQTDLVTESVGEFHCRDPVLRSTFLEQTTFYTRGLSVRLTQCRGYLLQGLGQKGPRPQAL
jgi:hypothetical protein